MTPAPPTNPRPLRKLLRRATTLFFPLALFITLSLWILAHYRNPYIRLSRGDESEYDRNGQHAINFVTIADKHRLYFYLARQDRRLSFYLQPPHFKYEPAPWHLKVGCPNPETDDIPDYLPSGQYDFIEYQLEEHLCYYCPSSPENLLTVLFFGFIFDYSGADGNFDTTLAIPFYFPTLLFALPPTLLLYRHLRRKKSPTLCPTCSYDLRATPTQCPECGHTP